MELREALLAKNDFDVKPISVKGWPDGLHVRQLSGLEQAEEAAFADQIKGAVDNLNVMARFVALCLCDAEGTCLFSRDNKEDIGLLVKRGMSQLTEVFDAATEFSGLSEKAVEDAGKNS